jgi:hypothetical protein
MTVPFERLKARLLANPKVKAEYNALACAQVCRKPNWLNEWGPASPPSLDLKAVKRYRARRRSCVMPRQPGASST